ncbi:hypothetical protein AQUCO_00800022v1 [Aquilegia coerulea]|uniref:SPRY domain-containing protein n=1 Tax=Aquilegia coerulea TaxID=218851 RepID=A0A2G5EH31_AQUCA|nr:hypothetical protein AQUCO_00800022v1 [Aquilegia coerulea]
MRLFIKLFRYCAALHEQGFAYCWSIRANVGIKGGKYMFSFKVIATQPVQMEDTPPEQQHVCRVGISRGDDIVSNLGETAHTFGHGGTGKFSSSGKFSNHGKTFGVGDTIACMVDLESKPLASVGFSKNRKCLGIAKEFDTGPNGLGVMDSPLRDREWEAGIFPHVLLKNVVVELQFSVEDGLVLEGGYKAWNCEVEDGNAVMGLLFSDTKDCEIVMMVGLPASGKTTWAEKWVKEHPEKRYLLLGTNLALDQMKVPGLLRKQNYGERFDRLMDRATGIFNTLLARAAKTPRNFIIDQTNIYKNARILKLRPFFQYQKIAVVVVFPKPDVVKVRTEKRLKEMGKEVPAEAVNEMLASYVLPKSKNMRGSDEHFDQVWFPELNREESQRYLEEMKCTLVSSSISPYSSQTSVQSFSSPSRQPGGVMSSAYPGVGLRGQLQYVSGQSQSGVGLQGQSHFVPGQYQSGTRPDSYGNYSMLDQNQRLNLESRSPVPGNLTGGYQN